MPVAKSQKQQPRERRSAGKRAEPVAAADTKKDIAARQQALKQVNLQRAADNIDAHAKAKLENPQSICESHTLVAGSSGSAPEKVPDLSEWWVTRSPINFLAFLPQDNTGWYGDGGNTTMDEREQVVEFANDDCATLLKLPHHQFWSHVVHNTAFGRFKDTYLRHTTRYFDGEWTAAAALGADAAQRRSPPAAEGQLARRVFMILLRMSQWQEDEAHFMTKAEFAEMIYEQWLWDIPSLLDVAVIYGRANPELTAELIGRVFSANKKYADDLADAVDHICSKLGEVGTLLAAGRAGAPGTEEAATTADALLFVLDSVHTLHSFLSVCPSALQYFVRVSATDAGEGALVTQLLALYDAISQHVEGGVGGGAVDALWESIKPVCAELLDMLLRGSLLEPALDACELRTRPQRGKAATVDGKRVVAALSAMAKAAGDSGCPGLLKQWAAGCGLSASLRLLEQKNAISEAAANELVVLLEIPQAAPVSHGVAPEALAAARGPVDPNVTTVKEFAGQPDLDDAFVVECLKHYDGSVEEVVQALVMENLPPHLVEKKNRPVPTPAPAPARGGGRGKGSAGDGRGRGRRSVFDGDKFDIFRAGAEDEATADLFSRQVQQGKGRTTEGLELLDGASAAERDAFKQHTKLAIARQEEEAEQRRILEKLNAAAAEEEARAQAGRESRAAKLQPGADEFHPDDVSSGEAGDSGAGQTIERATTRYEADLAREAAGLEGGIGGLMRTFSSEQELLYDDEYDDAMDEFDPSGGLAGGVNDMEEMAAKLQVNLHMLATNASNIQKRRFRRRQRRVPFRPFLGVFLCRSKLRGAGCVGACAGAVFCAAEGHAGRD